jgi:hypothetical protein
MLFVHQKVVQTLNSSGTETNASALVGGTSGEVVRGTQCHGEVPDSSLVNQHGVAERVSRPDRVKLVA